jgi:hypothetical protein
MFRLALNLALRLALGDATSMSGVCDEKSLRLVSHCDAWRSLSRISLETIGSVGILFCFIFILFVSVAGGMRALLARAAPTMWMDVR